MRAKFLSAAALALGIAATPAPTLAVAADADIPALKAEAAGLVKAYATQLQTALKGAMDATGPLGALTVCHEQAPAIAADLSSRSGWKVARTSLKPRNSASAPDAYETKVMEGFQARLAKGEPAENLASAEMVESDGHQAFRFIKAIPTGELCLTCHGTEVKPEIKAKIAELYPDDRATGFKLGDMRGVFTLTKGM